MSVAGEHPVGAAGLAVYARVRPSLVELEIPGEHDMPFRTLGVVLRRHVVGAAMALVYNVRGVMDLGTAIVRQGDKSWKAEVDNIRRDWGCAMYVEGEFELAPLETRVSTTLAVGEKVLVVAPGATGHHLAWGTLVETLDPGADRPYDRSVAWFVRIPEHGPADHALAFDTDGRIAGVVESIRPESDIAALLPGERLIGVVARNFAEFLMEVGAREQLIDQYRKNPEGFTDAGSLCVVGLALRSVGSLEEAIEAWNRAARIDPRNPWPLQAVGDALAGLGRTQEASEAQAMAREAELARPAAPIIPYR